MAQLAKMVREKYPDAYDDLDDDELEQLVTDKYPGAYEDLIEKEEPKKKSIFSKPEPFKPAGDDNLVTKAIRVISPGFEKKQEDSKPAEEVQKELADKGDFISRTYNKDPEKEPSLLPSIKQPETWTGGFFKSLYDDYVKPLGTVPGIAENIGLGMMGGAEKAAANIPKSLAREAPKIKSSEHPPIRQSVEQPYKFNGNLPEVNSTENLPIRHPIRDITPELPPDLVPVGEEDIFNSVRTKTPIKDSEETIFKNAQDKFNMGKELPSEGIILEEKPTATFKGMQETGDPANPMIPLFDIQGGPANNSTVSLEGLQKYGIEVPEFDPNVRPKSGQQLRDEAIATRKATEEPFNPFKGKTNLKEGEIGPAKDYSPEELIQSVKNGDKPASILENVEPNKREGLIKYAKDNGLEVVDNPIVPDEPIIAKDKATGEALVESLKNGDHETNGKLLGYSPEDIAKFSESLPKSESIHPQLSALKNYGDGVLYMDFDSSKSPLTIDDVKASIPDLGAVHGLEVTEMAGPKGKQSFRIDLKGSDEVHSAELGDKLEGLAGGSFDNEIELHGGLGGIGKGKNKPEPAKGPYGSALDKLFSSMGKLKEGRVEQDIINKQERARRFAASAGVKEEGKEGAKKSLAAMKGEFEKVDTDKLKLGKKETDSLFTAIKKAKITEGEKIRAYSSLFKILNGEGVPQRNELALLDEVFGNGFASRITELHGGIGAVGLKLVKTANTMKAMKSSIDLSAPLRQGIGLIHSPEYRTAFKEMFKYFGDKDYFDSAMLLIEQDADFIKSREAGLFLAKSENILQGEEAFANNYIGNVPGLLKAPFRASERAYTGFLNSLRFDTFKNLIKNAEDMGHKVFDVVKNEDGSISSAPTEVAENIAKYINTSTGRGGLGKLERIAPEMNAVLWSPRLISSRLSILNPKYYTKMDAFTRREAVKSLLAIAAAGSTVTGLGVLAGGKTSLDPNSSDFMKARFGRNVLDPFAGFQQVIVAASRLISGTSNNKPQTRAATIGNFTANKLSPMAALAFEVASARKWTGGGDYVSRFGEKKNLAPEIRESFTPMFIQDVTDVLSSDADFAEQIGLDTASLFGMGVQDYSESKKGGFRRMRP